MDIERLQDVASGRATGRRAGRTYLMLVNLAQQADFTNETHRVIAHSTDYARRLLDEFVVVVRDLGFEPERGPVQNSVVIDGSTFIFSGPPAVPFRGGDIIVWEDHYTG